MNPFREPDLKAQLDDVLESTKKLLDEERAFSAKLKEDLQDLTEKLRRKARREAFPWHENGWVWAAGGFALIVVLVLVCVKATQPSHELTTAPDGKTAWLVSCASPGDCVREAATVCPNGYATFLSGEENHHSGNTSTYSGSLVIRCSEKQ